MNTKFITPVSMEVTLEQYEKDLKEPLEALGYRWASCYSLSKDLANGYNYLVTNYADKGLGMISSGTMFKREMNSTYQIKEYNPQLFLALVAMTEGVSPIIREWMYCESWRGDMATEGEIYQVVDIDRIWGNDDTVVSTFGKWRKATKEELIEKFTIIRDSSGSMNEFVLPDNWGIIGCEELQEYFSDDSEIRCGHDIEHIDKSSLEYIADKLYTIIAKSVDNFDCSSFQKRIHNELCKTYLSRWDNLTHIETLIMIYRSELCHLKVAEHIGDNKWKDIIKLPTPKKRLFKRIIRGNGVYEDYDLIN